MDMYGEQLTKYDIPINHLDYTYIGKCSDTDELEKIIKILRSGKEGTYLDLEKFAEKRLCELKPTSRLLRKPERLATKADLDADEWRQIDEDLKNWRNDLKSAESDQGKDALGRDSAGDDGLPPVRGAASISLDKNKQGQNNAATKSNRRVKPRDYREWDKIDIDAELQKVGEEDSKAKTREEQKRKFGISETVDHSDLSTELKQLKAEREKDKGNEAFRAGDLDEALSYYNRSISLLPTVAAINNRAQTYLKQSKWSQALEDCNSVLEKEPENNKAILRRATAYQGLTRYAQARRDLDTLLDREPNNKQALDLAKAVDKNLADQKTHGRRMVIEEVNDSDKPAAESKLSKEPEIRMDKPVIGSQGPVVNGDLGKGKSVESDRVANVDYMSGDASEKKIQDMGKDNLTELPSTKTSEQKYRVGNSSGDANETSSNLRVTPDKTGSRENEKISQSDASSNKSPPAATANESFESPVVSVSEAPPPALTPKLAALKDEGNELFRAGQYAEALAKYDRAVALLVGDPIQSVNLSVLYSNRAACRMKTGDCRGCIADCDLALDLCPGSFKPLLRRGAAYEAIEKYREAFVDYRSVLNSGGASDVAQQGADRCAGILTEVDGRSWRDKLPKIPSFSSLASLLPPATPAPAKVVEPSANELFEKHKADGNKFFAKEEYEKAIEEFTKCIELFPDRAVPYTNRSLCYLRLNQCDQVLDDCNQALALEFNNVKALFRRAQAYKMKDQWEESVVDLETLLKIDPTNAAARKELLAVVKAREDEREKRACASLLRQQKQRRVVKIQDVDADDEEETDVKAPPPPACKNKKQDSLKSPAGSSATELVHDKQASPKNSAPHSSSTNQAPQGAGSGASDQSKSSGSGKKHRMSKAEQRRLRESAAAETAHGKRGPAATATVKSSSGVTANAGSLSGAAAPSGGGVAPQGSAPITPYEFLQSWAAVKAVDDAVPYAELLVRVKPQDLKSVVSNKLDGDLLVNLIRSAAHIISKGDARLGYEYLKHLPTLARFNIVSMFLSDTDKKAAKEAFQLLEKTDISKSDLTQTRGLFGL